MDIHVELSESELSEALAELQKLVVTEAGATISQFHAVVLWIPVGFCLAYIADKFGGTAALWALAAVVFLTVGSNYLNASARKRLHAYISNGSLARHVDFSFGDELIDVKTPNTFGQIPWTLIRQVHRSEQFVFLFIDSAQSYMIPTRLTQTEALYELAVSKLPESAC